MLIASPFILAGNIGFGISVPLLRVRGDYTIFSQNFTFLGSCHKKL